MATTGRCIHFQSESPKGHTEHEAARLFDPFGWFAPVIVRAKILYQLCWLYDLNWHDPLPPCVEELWVEMKENLSQLEQIKIPRWTANFHGRIELHGFSDASEEAYAAVVYLRSVSDLQQRQGSLQCDKSLFHGLNSTQQNSW